MTVPYRVQSGMFSLLETEKLNLFKPKQDRKSHESRPDTWLLLFILNMIGELYQSRKQKKKKKLTHMGKLDKCDVVIDPVSEW